MELPQLFSSEFHPMKFRLLNRNSHPNFMCAPQSLTIFFNVNSQKCIFQEVDFHDLGNWKKELCFFLILSMILGQWNFKQKLTSTQLAISFLVTRKFWVKQTMDSFFSALTKEKWHFFLKPSLEKNAIASWFPSNNMPLRQEPGSTLNRWSKLSDEENQGEAGKKISQPLGNIEPFWLESQIFVWILWMVIFFAEILGILFKSMFRCQGSTW